MSEWIVCEGCRRHVRNIETACPFCGVGLAFHGEVSPVRVPATLGTAKKVFFGLAVTGVAATLTACGEASDAAPPTPPTGGATGSGGAGGAGGSNTAPQINVNQGVAGKPSVPVIDPGGGVPIYRAPPLPLQAPSPKTPTSPVLPANRAPNPKG